MIETCDCADNEKEERTKIEIEELPASIILRIVRHLPNGVVRDTEDVHPNTAITRCGKSYKQLKDLGPGEHEICRCRRIGPGDAIFRPLK